MQFPDLARFAVYRGDKSYEGHKRSIESYKQSFRAFKTAGKQMATLFIAVKTCTDPIRELNHNQAQEDSDKWT